MLIYPTIELQNSKPVSLYRGNLDEPQIWHVNPLEKALEFARAGAEWPPGTVGYRTRRSESMRVCMYM